MSGVNNSHTGIFNPDDVADMRQRLRQGDMPAETPSERENRAVSILLEKEAGRLHETPSAVHETLA